MAAEFFDSLEIRDPARREVELMAALPGIIAAAKDKAPAYRALLAKVRPQDVTDRRALVDLPVIHKSDLIEWQRRDPPFGGLTTVPVGQFARVFASPGPIYEPQARRPDYFRMARALFAAGFRAGDLVHNTFAYHLTPAGAMLESAAEAIGCAVIPAGVGQSEQQVRTIADLKPAAYVGTPSFLKILLDKAQELGADISCLTKAMVGAEAFPSVLRTEFRSRGIAAMQCYGTADIGLISYETTGPDGEVCDGMVLDEGVILEIVQPGTGEPVPPGEVGEVVVTTLTPEYPLIRFATGDLSAQLTGPSPCGRTNHRIKGWLGRADQTAKIRGMFVHPVQVAEIVRQHKSIIRARIAIERPAAADVMNFLVEMGEPPETEAAIAETVQAVTKLRATVIRVPEGSLPNDGKVIEDRRPIG
ncbi:MAG TPA: AMP-binding protein [Stellaceae bacterium]|jgi:phenylacetate-CoA ligase|nr:AMP-binding protein [Stellaceae bacterium]